MPGRIAATRSISSSVLLAPRLKRIEFCVRCSGKPIAFSTCDGSSVPEEHAEPVDTATPARSSAISSDSASIRSKLMLVVFGTRASRAPVAQRREPCPLARHLRASLLRGGAHADNPSDVLGAGTAVSLVFAAGED